MRTSLLLTAALFITVTAHAQTANVGIGTTTPTDQLHTTGTVRFQNYAGVTSSAGTRLVQIDATGRLVVTGAGTTFKAPPAGLGIPDNGCASGTGYSSTISVSGQAASVASPKISVRLNITHPSSQELRVFLIAPGGTQILRLSNGAGAGASYVNTVITDEAVGFVNNGSSPFTGKYKPSGGLTVSCGLTPTVSTFAEFGSSGTINPNGTWELRVFDAQAALGGVLNSWEISFSGPESFTTVEQDRYLPRFAGGTLAASTLYQGTGATLGIRTTSPDAALNISDAGGDSLLLLENPDALAAGSKAFIDFRNGSAYTGRIGTVGVDAQTASLGFFTGVAAAPSNLQRRMSILDNGRVGIGVVDASVAEQLHVDGGNMKLGLATWATTANDRLLKFGDGNYVSVGEAGEDDRLELTGTSIILKRLTGNTSVGINTNTAPAYTLDVAGTARTTGSLTVGGLAQVADLRVTSGSPAVGDVLTAANTTGAVSWQTPAASPWTRNNLIILPTAASAYVGIAAALGQVTERLHVDTGNIKIGRVAWASSVNDRFLKFGDGDYVSVGETSGDDRMMLTGKQFAFRAGPTSAPRARLLNSELRLYESTGADSTIIFNGARGTGQSGEIYFFDPGTNERTLTIDGDFNNSNRSRIIVDELQITGGSDFAEMFDVAPVENVSPKAGMLVSIDEAHPGSLIVSTDAYDNKVAGVISGAGGVKPGMMMGQKGTSANGAQPIAITGRVYVKADARGEAIRPGDLLTTSSLPGYAMKAADRKKRDGAVIGKAMTPLAKGATGEVLVLLGIQ